VAGVFFCPRTRAPRPHTAPQTPGTPDAPDTPDASFSTGYNAVGLNANIRIIDSDAINNTTGIAGNVRSAGDNRFAANGSNGTPQPTDITIQ